MKFSIVTINYNNLPGLKKTAESVIAQTGRSFEWIIIDGGSSDGSKEYIEHLAKELSSSWSVEQFSLLDFTAKNIKAEELSLWERNGERLLLYCSEPDRGIYNAMNKGIAKACGEYTIFMNSGDCFYESETLQKVVAMGLNADVVFGDADLIKEGKSIGICSTPHSDEIYGLYRRNICHQAMFMRTKLVQKNGFDESYKLLADVKMYLQAALTGATFQYIPVIVCKYDIVGATSTYAVRLKEEAQTIESLYPQSVLKSLQRLDFYERQHQVLRVKKAIEKGGIALTITNYALKVIDWLFLHIDFSKRDFS